MFTTFLSIVIHFVAEHIFDMFYVCEHFKRFKRENKQEQQRIDKISAKCGTTTLLFNFLFFFFALICKRKFLREEFLRIPSRYCVGLDFQGMDFFTKIIIF